MKIDFACGERKKEGFIGVDQLPHPDVDIVWDLNNYPYPFEDESVDEIYCSQFIEHVDDLVKFMGELYRVMKHGATGIIIAPYWSHINTWRDPTHKRGIADTTLYFFDKDWRDSNRLGCYNIDTNFSVGWSLKMDEYYIPEYNSLDDKDKVHAMTHYINVFAEVTFNIVKK